MEFVDVVMKRRAVRRFEEGGVEPRRHRADRPARPAQRRQPGSARASGSSSSRSRSVGARSPGSAARSSTPTSSGRGSASAPRSSCRACRRRSTTAATRRPTRSRTTAPRSTWPVPYWFVDVGGTMQTIWLAAVERGLGCGFVGTDDLDALAGRPRHPRRVHADRGDAGRAGRCRTCGHPASSEAGCRSSSSLAGERWD